MSVSYDFEPKCPIRSSEKCTYKCAWSIKIDGNMHACAIAIIAAKGFSDCGINVEHPEKETQ